MQLLPIVMRRLPRTCLLRLATACTKWRLAILPFIGGSPPALTFQFSAPSFLKIDPKSALARARPSPRREQPRQHPPTRRCRASPRRAAATQAARARILVRVQQPGRQPGTGREAAVRGDGAAASSPLANNHQKRFVYPLTRNYPRTGWDESGAWPSRATRVGSMAGPPVEIAPRPLAAPAPRRNMTPSKKKDPPSAASEGDATASTELWRHA